MKRSKNWCFTDFELLNINAIINQTDKLSYICWGLETCPKTNKKHYQGWLQCKIGMRITGIKKIFKTKKIHLEACKGNEQSNDKYCQKDNIYKTWGEYTTQGSRTDIHTIYNDIINGSTELEISRKHPVAHAKYHKAFARKIKLEQNDKAMINLKKEYNNVILKEWQLFAIKILKLQSNRQILWIVDQEGNQGKTFLGKYLVAENNAFYIRNGKSTDIAYAYNNQKIVVFDYTREQEERINYQSIENFKDGILFSPKYESTTKIFTPCKVIIFSNFHPDESKLSKDRWHILSL